jgi:hypothetical protein
MPFARMAACAAVAVIAGFTPEVSARLIDAPRSTGSSSAVRSVRPAGHTVASRHDASDPPRHERGIREREREHVPPNVARESQADAPAKREAKTVLPSRHGDSHGAVRDPALHGHDRKRALKHAAPPPRPLRAVRAMPASASWRAYHKKPWQRGFVTLFGHGQKWSGYLVDKYGDVIPAARKSVSSVLASWRTGKQMLIDERLLALVADVSDEFGGRPIRIVSGYREHSYAPDSRHKSGEAFDFSVPDVPNEAVRDFLRSLPDVGVGYYPNSTHVHLDVRDKQTYWVDYSRPGDQPVYSWDRRVAGFTPRERALANALDSLLARARGTASSATQAKTEMPHVSERAPLTVLPTATGTATTTTTVAAHAPSKVVPRRAPASSDVDADDEREEDAGNRPSADAASPSSTERLLPKAPAASAVSPAAAPDAGRR